jgi:hypothetical protein
MHLGYEKNVTKFLFIFRAFFGPAQLEEGAGGG